MRLVREQNDFIVVACKSCGKQHTVEQDNWIKTSKGYNLSPALKCPCGNVGTIAKLSANRNGRKVPISLVIFCCIFLGIAVGAFLISQIIGVLLLLFIGIVLLVTFVKDKQQDVERNEHQNRKASVNVLLQDIPNFNKSNSYVSGSRKIAGIAFDDINKKICIIDNSVTKVVGYKDLLESQVLIDNIQETITSRKSQLGGAIVGSILAGGVGAVIGGLSGKTKTSNIIKKVELKITINDTKHPVQTVTFLDDQNGVSKEDEAFRKASKQADYWQGLISVLMKQADEEDNPSNPKIFDQKNSLADELTKLVELHKNGILTKEEFESQKGKLLAQ
ncbi:SHOCT domain-containing protein [Paenibacillus dokdonensis]|uniref:SHOCT domain-containing protein n=1 Tax=Paenibacillus dokdonensis TaxID=2567944 RepID=UPI0010A7CD61|nr:SHOCT domain-containing protein [Paenibacillus dokdonensis]